MKIYYDSIKDERHDISEAFAFEDNGISYDVRFPDGALFKTDNIYILNGNLSFSFKANCDRCLKLVDEEIKVPVSVTLDPGEPFTPEFAAEHEIVDSEGDTYYTDPEFFDICDILRQEVLLSLPSKIVCSDGCNPLPEEVSNVEVHDQDTPGMFKKLSELKNKFKEK